MTGNIGRPGTGANSITGQCNAMGSRLFSNTTNLLGGHDFANADAPREGRRRPRHRLASAIPHAEQPGLRPDPRGHRRGKIKGLWIIAHEPGAFLDQPADAFRSLLEPARLPRRAGHVRDDRDRAARRTSCCPRPAGARRKARSSTPSGASACQEGRARAGPGAGRLPHLPADRRGVGLRRDVRALDFARGRVPVSSRSSRAASRATSPASRTTPMLDAAGGIQWPWPRTQFVVRRIRMRTRASRCPLRCRRVMRAGLRDAIVRGRQFFHPDGKARFVFEPRWAWPEATDAELPLGCLRAGAVPRNGTPARAPKNPPCFAIARGRPFMSR